jgi:hypothetical protein
MELRVKSERSKKGRDHYCLKTASEKKADDITFKEKCEHNNVERDGACSNEDRFTICA